jgi:hypothetical protein
MERVFEILPSTQAYEKIKLSFTWTEQFNQEFLKEFEEKIGVPFINNASAYTKRLLIERIPNGTREQFKIGLVIGDGCRFHEARQNSALNKMYLELIQKYQIKEYTGQDFKLEHVLAFVKHKQVRCFERYFITVNDPDATNEKIDQRDYFREVSLSEFLRAKADYLDYLELKKNKSEPIDKSTLN